MKNFWLGFKEIFDMKLLGNFIGGLLITAIAVFLFVLVISLPIVIVGSLN